MTQREEARMRLQDSVDRLGQQASLQVQMQKEPLKMLGIATGVGAVLGLVLGRSFSKTKKIYVDDTLSKKERKAFEKAQARHKGPASSIGGALLATLGTLAFKLLQDRVIAPKLEELAQNLTKQAGDAGKAPKAPKASKEVVIRDFRAPAEKAHADERGNLHLTPAQQAARDIAYASRDVPVRDFRVPAEKAHADQFGSVISEARTDVKTEPLATATSPSAPDAPKTNLQK
ncbi:hypothetical protein EHF33_04910 [Deinococcus psychrotolerans]|uniref:Uncharacterized protein n=1 Tax=Deinococcus psychrotolerans TaxID=2489213 RepID=A0A3G8YD51_9DEIO|nr:hypothetical protein [Deinococcus psychrotolerans]AZI42167.1 hypothetical protein EHF33_04910 [Deinococcus psychrotolerans]